jgi:hypothetical protein
MKKLALVLLACLTAVATVLSLTTVAANAMPDGTSRTSFFLQPNYSQRDIYTPQLPSDYRTSPSVFKDSRSGQYYQFNCGPDASHTTQVIRSSTSSDGHTWSAEAVMLRPTPNGPDQGGVCDPNVTRWSGFFYMAYTGFDAAHHASVFIARTTSLSQSWQKWNGQSWGGSGTPKPIVTPDAGWVYGVGQPTIVLAANEMMIFYDVHTGAAWQTRLATVAFPARDTWPADVKLGGVVLRHPGTDFAACGGYYDSTSVSYNDLLNEYVAVTVDSQDYTVSHVQTYESSTGSDFTKALTVALPDHRVPVPDHAHNLSFVTTGAGHIVSASDASIVYSYGETDCPVKLGWQDAFTGAEKSGWASTLNPTTGASGWEFSPTDWRADPGTGDLSAVNKIGDPVEAEFTGSMFGSSSTIDLDYSQGVIPTNLWSELSFGQTPNQTGGYHLRISPLGPVTLYSRDPDNPVATGSVTGSAQFFTNHLQVVLSGNTIAVYNGRGSNTLLKPIIRYTAPDKVYLDGSIGLGSNGSSVFSNLTVRDDVPANYRSQNDTVLDWKPTGGSWSVFAPSSLFSYLPSGQIFLQGRAAPVANYNAQLGDGSYSATVQLNPSSPAQSWGGLNLTNDDQQANPFWGDGGYLVFIRANGNVGVWRGGRGQVVSDVATGLNPVTTPVTLTVLKTGRNLQVYVNHNPVPIIMYTDYVAPTTAGTFGVATEQTSGVITGVTYAANGASS